MIQITFGPRHLGLRFGVTLTEEEAQALYEHLGSCLDNPQPFTQTATAEVTKIPDRTNPTTAALAVAKAYGPGVR